MLTYMGICMPFYVSICWLYLLMKEIISYLRDAFDIPLRDPLWKHVYLNEAFQKLVYSQPFLRLGQIRQLSCATLVYPGARHTRLEHSIGVFWMARRLLLALLCSKNSAAAEFVPSLSGVKAFLAAALLHDLGHFPYAHNLEGLSCEHEQLSARYILEPPLFSLLSEELGTDPALVAALVDEDLRIPERYQSEGPFYRSLLSGTLDPDKLDYLNRDAYYCGVPYGIQDLDYLLSQVHICRLPAPTGNSENQMLRIGIPERGLTIIESLIFSRYLMYRSIYWHRNVRALSAPVQKAVSCVLELGLLDEQQIIHSDDNHFPDLFSGLNVAEKELCLQAQKPRSFLVVDELCLGSAPESFLAQLRKYRERQKICHALYPKLCRLYKNDLQPWQVILDLSGPRKMQIADIYVSSPLYSQNTGNAGIIPFMQSSTVLQPGTLEDFRKALTTLRLILPTEYAWRYRNRIHR